MAAIWFLSLYSETADFVAACSVWALVFAGGMITSLPLTFEFTSEALIMSSIINLNQHVHNQDVHWAGGWAQSVVVSAWTSEGNRGGGGHDLLSFRHQRTAPSVRRRRHRLAGRTIWHVWHVSNGAVRFFTLGRPLDLWDGREGLTTAGFQKYGSSENWLLAAPSIKAWWERLALGCN